MRAAHHDYLAFAQPIVHSGPVQLGEIVAGLASRLPADAIVTNGAGNYATWVHRHWIHRGFGTQLAPTSGSMGYGLPAAVAAKLAEPGRVVVNFSGDGCFLMHGQEFATAVKYGAAIVAVVVDNGMYGTIRMHQEREYPGRVSGTGLTNPDFAAYARAFGGHGERVTATAEFEPAFARAIASGKPAVIHVLIDPEAITPARGLSAIRAAAEAARAPA
jgi:acetolactate synthase-1/2/3 large subunit